MTLPLPDPLVARHADTPLLGEDQDHRVSPWGVQRNFETIAQRFPLGPDDLHFGGTVTALPTGVDEGFEVNYIASASAGVVWRFKYLPTTSGTYPWLFIGGSPLVGEVDASEGVASATYAALGTAGPSVALPLAGDYDIEHGARMYGTVDASSVFMSYDIGGAGAVDADAIDYYVGATVSGGATAAPHMMRANRKTGLTAVTLTAKYRASAGTVTAGFRWLRATPVRVG